MSSTLARPFNLSICAAFLASTALAQDVDLPELGPDVLLFSVENMDLSADPKQDFYRFAAGGWLDRVERPADKASYSFVSVQAQRITDQIKAVVLKAAEDAATAPKGSPTQLVGDFYTAYMDVDGRNAAGMAPLQDEIDRIDAIASLDDLTRYTAHALKTVGMSLFAGFAPQTDLADNTRYAIFSGPGAAGIDARDVYSSEDGTPRRDAYRKYVNDLLLVAGYEPAEAEALAKLRDFDNKVGFPEHWIDFSGVEIVPDDAVANMLSVSAFGIGRELDRYGGPVETDDFNNASTLPVALNAAYVFARNGFQITAAISQPPAFEPDADPAVRFCRFGGIIGHEATHGFDTAGRQFDADGNLRDWWTEEDTEAFIAEAKKLVEQTEATELAPGHVGNGALWVTENIADVGGIKLGYSAMLDYLADHPEENVEIDGFTQQQRCFIAWTQMWAENATEASLINYASSANHPPNIYRTTAPLQHFDAFYEAFDIKEGDAMWLPQEKRVNAW